MSAKKGLTRRTFITTVGAGAAAASLPVYINPRVSRSAKMTQWVYGEGPFVSKGPNMVAFAKGYYKKMGIDLKFKWFFDGALMVAPLLAGELDLCSLTVSAGFFNAVARGGDLTMFLDGGTESKKDRSYVVTVANQKLYDQGIRTARDLKKIADLPVHVSDKGSINHYHLDHSYMAAGVDPRKLQIKFGLPPAQGDAADDEGRRQRLQPRLPLRVLPPEGQEGANHRHGRRDRLWRDHHVRHVFEEKDGLHRPGEVRALRHGLAPGGPNCSTPPPAPSPPTPTSWRSSPT